MSLWQRIFQGLIAFWGTNVITTVSGVLQAMLVFRYLAVDGYGALTLMLSVYAIASIFLDFGVGGVFVTEAAKARGLGRTSRVRALLWTYGKLLISTGSTLGLLFAIYAWIRQDPWWAIIGAYLLATALNNSLNAVLYSYTRFRRVAAQGIVRSVSRLLLLLVVPFVAADSMLIGVALTYPLMEIVSLLFTMIFAWGTIAELRRAPAEDVQWRRLMQQQGVYVMLLVPVKKVLDQLPVWFLKALVGDVGVGLYGAAKKAYGLVLAFLQPLEAILSPLVAEQAESASDRIRIALRQTQKYTFWISVGMAAILIPLSPLILRVIAGAEYAEAIPVLQWMLLGLLVIAFQQSQRPTFYAVSQQKWLLVSYLVGLACYIPAMWVGITWNGVVGAAQAYLILTFVILAIRLGILHRIAPALWVSPWSVVQIDDFDRQLLKRARQSFLHSPNPR